MQHDSEGDSDYDYSPAAITIALGSLVLAVMVAAAMIVVTA